MSAPETEQSTEASPAELASGDPDGVEEVRGPVYVKDPPSWSYFLTPAALIVGSLIIAATIWWTRDTSGGDSGAPSAVAGAVSTVLPANPTTAASSGGLLDTMKAYARETGINEAQFSQCLSDPDNVSSLNASLQEGSSLGVSGTPTFFINNKKLVGAQPLALFQEIIQAELKGSPTSLDGYSAGLRALAANNPPGFEIVAERPDFTGAQVEGSADAKVMIVEFSDFQCPFCKQWIDSSLKQLRKQLGTDVALAFMHFPIVQIHPNAGNASLVAICAGQQGKFWEMHDLLFARQNEWASLK